MLPFCSKNNFESKGAFSFVEYDVVRRRVGLKACPLFFACSFSLFTTCCLANFSITQSLFFGQSFFGKLFFGNISLARFLVCNFFLASFSLSRISIHLLSHAMSFAASSLTLFMSSIGRYKGGSSRGRATGISTLRLISIGSSARLAFPFVAEIEAR